MKKTLLASFLSLSIFFALGAVIVLAQSTGSNPAPITGSNPAPITGSNPGLPIKIDNPFKVGNTLFDVLKAIVNDILMPIGGILAVLAFIYSGFLYVTAQGNETKIKTAHTALLYTAIGTAVLLGAKTIADVIGNTINQLK